MEDFRLHDCRHTFASYQAMAGIQARGLQTLLGHPGRPHDRPLLAPERCLPESGRRWRRARTLESGSGRGRIESGRELSSVPPFQHSNE
ncbi:hypothetical protein [Candidatus Binatus sp.]|uniref:hypothetical protein n=1 Tax=Candidatus Binatus sp. TaxID=2811406 RepID=UPI003CC66622